MATRVKSKSGKFPYEIPHIIHGGFHTGRPRSERGFLMPAGMRIPGKPRSDRELLRPTICTGTIALARSSSEQKGKEGKIKDTPPATGRMS